MATTVEARSHRGPDVIEPTRMVNLSDAVFAIAMTLLVLGLEVPDVEASGLGPALRAMLPNLLAFALAFGLVCNVWWVHHRLFARLAPLDRGLVAINLVLLGDRGYEVFAVNPNADEVEGDRCYHDLGEIPGGVEAVVIATAPEAADGTMRECVELGIPQVWMHRAFGAGSVSSDAAAYGREHGITVIAGGCPLMFEPTADGGHKFLRVVCSLAGTVPRTVERPVSSV